MKTAQEFIDFYSQIPEEKWSMGMRGINPDSIEATGAACAYGHLGMRQARLNVVTDNGIWRNEDIDAMQTMDRVMSNQGHGSLVRANDGLCREPGAKARVLAWLAKAVELGL